MAVSSALFGFGFSGVFLSILDPKAIPKVVARAAAAAPWAMAGGFLLFNLIPVEPFLLMQDGTQWLWFVLALLCLAIPFFSVGIAVGALFSEFSADIHRIYMFDLVGAGVGSALTVWAIPQFGGVGAIACAALLAAFGALALSFRASRVVRVCNVIAVFGLALALPWADRALPLRVSRDKGVRGGEFSRAVRDQHFHLETRWTPDSRVDVFELGPGMRHITIDAGASTVRLASEGLWNSLRQTTEESFFYRLKPRSRALVVGSGGGRELLIGLKAGASELVAVEVNAALNDLLLTSQADFTSRIAFDPRVRLITDEGRSFLERDRSKYDLIHFPHTISNAAVTSGSLALAESYLMTREAFHAYFEHLNTSGLLLITRPEAHLPRLVVTLREVSRVPDLSQRILIWRSPSDGLAFHAGLAVRNAAFTREEVEAFQAELLTRKLEPLYLPGQSEGLYSELLRAADVRQVQLPFAALLYPSSDDRPFFNQRSELSKLRWSDWAEIFGRDRQVRNAVEERPIAEVALWLMLIISVIMGAAILLAARFQRRDSQHHLAALSLAFAALGLGYIVLELSWVQRLTLFLGRPVIVFATVLPVLLIASGLGGLFARRFTERRMPMVACIAVALLAGVSYFATVWICAAALAAPLGIRIFIAALCVFPTGFVMGAPFPLLLHQVQKTQPRNVPWAWGVNGFASVVGSVLAVSVGMSFGYNVVSAIGVLAYAVAAVASRALLLTR
jgi:hypothetical protein